MKQLVALSVITLFGAHVWCDILPKSFNEFESTHGMNIMIKDSDYYYDDEFDLDNEDWQLILEEFEDDDFIPRKNAAQKSAAYILEQTNTQTNRFSDMNDSKQSDDDVEALWNDVCINDDNPDDEICIALLEFRRAITYRKHNSRTQKENTKRYSSVLHSSLADSSHTQIRQSNLPKYKSFNTNDPNYISARTMNSMLRENIYLPDDIPESFKKLAQHTQLSDFVGRWELISERSDSLDEILRVLGLSSFKRRVMCRHKSIVDIIMPKPSLLHMKNYLPAGIVVEATVPTNGTPFVYHEKETGEWSSRAYFLSGRLYQIRESSFGMMYDTRVVFNQDPLRRDTGPLMLFKWTFIPSGSKAPYRVNRWLRRTQ